MAECALPRGAASRTRIGMMCAGVVAANAPDIDLLYTGITEEPLGYLLHHRGHSHTLPALAALGILIWLGLRLFPSLRSDVRGAERRWIVLIAAALASHLLMDAANNYGTHPFYPFSSRWIYGDAVFVIEPWLWAILGTALALNAAWPARVLIAVLTLSLIAALGVLGILHRGMLVLMLGVAGSAAFMVWTWDRKRRAAAALVAAAAIFLTMPLVSRVAKAAARRAFAGVYDRNVIDIVADANPGVPWCWAVLMVERPGSGPKDVLVAHRATLSLVPRVWPAASCASARLSARRAPDIASSESIVWHRRWQIDAEGLRALANGNCRVRAWLQFGRVPYVANGRIVDLRFETPIGQNFTSMPLEGTSGGCPARVTDWTPPRNDVLTSVLVIRR
jgi:inner membrane protein